MINDNLINKCINHLLKLDYINIIFLSHNNNKIYFQADNKTIKGGVMVDFDFNNEKPIVKIYSSDK